MLAAEKWSPLIMLTKALKNSAFYHSDFANRIRDVLNSKVFLIVMVTSLLLALFVPDMFVLAGVGTDIEKDVILTAVMLFFVVEFVCLSLTDVAYFLGFFFWMDILGTCSMMLDISWMFGDSAEVATTLNAGGSATANLMLLRASRAAKIGARAGRLTRLLRILRFLPLLTGGTSKSQSGMATMISGQLANLLATRVACLTIVLTMCIPMFDILNAPNDNSLQAWADRLNLQYSKGRTEALERELGMMTDFYDKARVYYYGPYSACSFKMVSGDAICDESYQDLGLSWTPRMQEPGRLQAALKVKSGTFMVFFNMFHTQQFSASMNIGTMCFIIFIMIFSGLTFSSVVTELAVRPLERMLATVREIATTVFKFAMPSTGESEADDDIDIQNSTEMKLLEKVVEKLAIIAQLQTAKTMEHTEDMDDEDIGVLSLLKGQNVVEEKKEQGRRSMAVVNRKSFHTGGMQKLRVEDFGVSSTMFASWSFNALALASDKAQRLSLAVFTISRFHEAGENFVSSASEEQRMKHFMEACDKEYPANPFHNFSHAVDVLHGVARLMTIIGSEAFLTDLEQFSLLVAGISHDLAHPGVNNGFLIEVGHELAIQYNDKSPLENMHCAKMYEIVGNKDGTDCNIFASLTKEQHKEVRKHCIETILHTDMMGHGIMVKELQMTFEMNREVFAAEPGVSSAGSNTAAELEIFNSPETKSLIMNNILHSADVSNPCRTWTVTQAWAMACLEEFFAQGDQEKTLGVPVQFLNDRDKLNRPNSQIGFIEFMIAPFFAAQVRLWPQLYELGDNLATNIGHWRDLWVQEVSPAPEDREKVSERVNRVQKLMNDAKNRAAD
jgi:hypothetical protein